MDTQYEKFKRYQSICWLFLLNAIIALSSCQLFNSNKEAPDGGPCSYRETAIKARVVAMVPLDTITYEVLFKLDSNDYLLPPDDTISFYMENGRYLSKAEKDSLGVVAGKTFTYLIRDIESGHCNPQIRQLVMEPVK